MGKRRSRKLKPGEFRIMDRTPRWTMRVVAASTNGKLTLRRERLPDLADYVFVNSPEVQEQVALLSANLTITGVPRVRVKKRRSQRPAAV